MAPEMYEEHYDEGVDVYAFGMCMLEMATSEYPYSECTGPAQIYKKVISGVKPASFEKVQNPEVKDVIESCIRPRKEDRPKVKDLLTHAFFEEDFGLKVEVVSQADNKVVFRLRVIDPKKRTHKHKENEAIQFEFDLETDRIDTISEEMAKSGIIFEEDAKTVAQLLKAQIAQINKEREQRNKEKEALAQQIQYQQYLQQQVEKQISQQSATVAVQQQQQQEYAQQGIEQQYQQEQVQYVQQKSDPGIVQYTMQPETPQIYQQEQHQSPPILQRQQSMEPVQQQPIIHKQPPPQQFVQSNYVVEGHPQQAEFLQVQQGEGQQHKLSSISQPELLHAMPSQAEHRLSVDSQLDAHQGMAQEQAGAYQQGYQQQQAQQQAQIYQQQQPQAQSYQQQPAQTYQQQPQQPAPTYQQQQSQTYQQQQQPPAQTYSQPQQQQAPAQSYPQPQQQQPTAQSYPPQQQQPPPAQSYPQPQQQQAPAQTYPQQQQQQPPTQSYPQQQQQQPPTQSYPQQQQQQPPAQSYPQQQQQQPPAQSYPQQQQQQPPAQTYSQPQQQQPPAQTYPQQQPQQPPAQSYPQPQQPPAQSYSQQQQAPQSYPQQQQQQPTQSYPQQQQQPAPAQTYQQQQQPAQTYQQPQQQQQPAPAYQQQQSTQNYQPTYQTQQSYPEQAVIHGQRVSTVAPPNIQQQEYVQQQQQANILMQQQQQQQQQNYQQQATFQQQPVYQQQQSYIQPGVEPSYQEQQQQQQQPQTAPPQFVQQQSVDHTSQQLYQQQQQQFHNYVEPQQQVLTQPPPHDPPVDPHSSSHRLSGEVPPPMNLVELQQKLAQQHRVSTASLPPMSTFESTPVDGRRLSTVSQPPSMQEYVLQQQIPEKDSLDDLAGKEEGKEDASTSEQRDDSSGQMLIKPTYDTYEDTFQGLKSTLSEKLTQNLRCRESLNSSGTVSRKTSTASDYTPENTYVSNNRMDQSTTVSFSSDTCVSVLKYPNEVAEDAKSEIDGQDLLKDELNDSLKRKDDVKLVPGQKVDLKVFILRTEAEPHEDGDEKKDEEKVEEKVEVQAVLKVPQRKISRFLVSPVLSGELDLPKDKDFGGNAELPPEEESTKIEALRKSSAPVESTTKNLEADKPNEQKISVSSLKEESTNKEEPVMCGPEMINTLEQLKISLDNLKNSMHPKKEPSESDTKKVSTGQAFVAATTTTTTTTATFVATQQQQQIQMTQLQQQPQQQNVAVTQPPVVLAQAPPQQNLILQQQPNYQQPVSQASPPQMMLNIQKPVEMAAAAGAGVIYQQPPPTGAMTASVSVQNLSMQAQQQQQFQHSISVDDNALSLHQQGGFTVKKLPPDSLKQISESASSRSSQVSTPQMDVKYDAQLQNLQHQLSSIPLARTQTTAPSSPQANAATLEFPQQQQPPLSVQESLVTTAISKLQAESCPSAPGSGAASSEMLSPAIELEPFAPPPTDIKVKQLADLNNQLKKINSRPEVIVETGEAIVPQEVIEGAAAAALVAAAATAPQKERRVSRFKVSVVTEPDRSKLVQPDDASPKKEGEEAKKDSDYTSVINNTFNSLANILGATLPSDTEFAPEVNRVKQHAVGTTAHHSHTHHVHKKQKSLSYCDLKKEIEHLLPMGRPLEEGNPRRAVGGRRMSKTFRQYPQIVVHPPDESLTSSLPDINANVDDHQVVINNVSDKNVSCPDLTDEKLYEETMVTSTNFKKTKLKTPLSRRNSDGVHGCLKRKTLRKKRKKKGETPGDLLKKNWKFKHSASMHNLKSNIVTLAKEENFDNYHTVHGGFSNIEMFAFDDNLNSRTNSTEVIYKCCCGRRLCEAVVPIQQYLETYFVNKTKETFEEMLNRQKAELNALMEAHRKQQLEFMESHRRQIEENKKM
ncbi:protein piccolo-like isoform X7 [Zophobas morio]